MADRIETYTRAIQNPQDSRELFRSHFRRAEAHREAGNAEMAFQDYYSAKIVSCWLEKNERFSRWRKSAGMIPSTYCRKWADQRMATVSSGIPPERQAALKLEAETALSRYLLK